MDILKRLVNVFALIAIALLVYGLILIAIDTSDYSAKVDKWCENTKILADIRDRREENRKTMRRNADQSVRQLIESWRIKGIFVPVELAIDAKPENIDESIDLYRAMCENSRPLSSIVAPGIYFLISFTLLFTLSLILNYVVFGKLTVWNRVNTSLNEQRSS